ncbi:hypothetical protein E2562_009835 [Oryza meyeriana var. granulata]|uniref:Uncharacterized protein n=1 Tax=Oryza meyeriana var. granulata TaxID=110450 RepID=A0A6G1BU35_9ORYZ|nr:hypothetical protein E2562_009835 [Oryza meyeriana var. granulata]
MGQHCKDNDGDGAWQGMERPCGGSERSRGDGGPWPGSSSTCHSDQRPQDITAMAGQRFLARCGWRDTDVTAQLVQFAASTRQDASCNVRL